ncbi:MAG: 2-hydroxyacid dehydrogenase [Candidatus Cyclobacteriaceae bacterium M3_2C_046]
MNVTIFSVKEFEKPYIKQANQERHHLNIVEEKLTEETVELAKDSDAIITFPTDRVSAEVLEQLKAFNIEYLATRSAGFDHIELDKARALGFKIANVPKYSPHAIAEHAVGMMLALNRKFITARRNIEEYDFRLNGLIGFDMNGKTVGILGAGKIGSVVVKILHGFGCKIIIYDPVKNEDLVKKFDARYVSLDELCQQSDIITIHAPYNKKTHKIINQDTIGQMKQGLMLINCGRGKIVDTEALIDGIKSGRIGSAGLDVYENEKGLFFYDHTGGILEDDLFARLLAFKNVMITGHQAFLTDTALKNMSGIAFDNINAWEEGKNAPNELDSEE